MSTAFKHGPVICQVRATWASALSRLSFLSLLIQLAIVGLTYAGDLQVVAGTGSSKNNGDEGVATEITVKDPFGVEIGPDGALYVTEVGYHRIRRIDLGTGRIRTDVGTGEKGYTGDRGKASLAKLNEPYEVRFDAKGNMYFVEMQNHIIRRVDAATGRIRTIAGTGKSGFSGDGGPAIQATMKRPHSIALDAQGNLYVADIGNHRIRRIRLRSGIIDTIAGNGERTLPRERQKARGNPLLGPRALFVQGNTMWIALREGHSVWRLDLQRGTLAHVAGNGQAGFRDGSSQEAQFNGPKGIVVDAQENVFVVDTENHAIRRIDGQTKTVSTIVGNGVAGGSLQQLSRPHGIGLGPRGMLYIGDTLNHRVVRLPNGSVN